MNTFSNHRGIVKLKEAVEIINDVVSALEDERNESDNDDLDKEILTEDITRLGIAAGLIDKAIPAHKTELAAKEEGRQSVCHECDGTGSVPS